MTDQQEQLIKELLIIKAKIISSNDAIVIYELVGEAIEKAIPIPPNDMNADILGMERLIEGKNRSIKLLQFDRDFLKTDISLEDQKFQVLASLIMLMLRFANGITIINEIGKKYSL